MLSKKSPTDMPKTGGGKGSGLVSPVAGGVSGIKNPGSKMNVKSMRGAGSKR